MDQDIGKANLTNDQLTTLGWVLIFLAATYLLGA